VRFDDPRDGENILNVSLEKLRLVIIAPIATAITLRGFAHWLDVHPDGEQQDGFARVIPDRLVGRRFEDLRGD
jgi:hypothetical protein